MIEYTSRLKEKDVINICTGKRIGYICDFLLDTDCKRITSIIVSERFFALVGGKNEICIPADRITCIGEDSVLVRIDDECTRMCQDKEEIGEKCRKRKSGGWFF